MSLMVMLTLIPGSWAMFCIVRRSTEIKREESMLSMPDGEMTIEILSSGLCCKFFFSSGEVGGVEAAP